METKGIVLGLKISYKGIEVDKANVALIEKEPPSTTIKGIKKVFLGILAFTGGSSKTFQRFQSLFHSCLRKTLPLTSMKSV